MSEEREQETKLTVVDRRRFTTDGVVRDGARMGEDDDPQPPVVIDSPPQPVQTARPGRAATIASLLAAAGSGSLDRAVGRAVVRGDADAVANRLANMIPHQSTREMNRRQRQLRRGQLKDVHMDTSAWAQTPGAVLGVEESDPSAGSESTFVDDMLAAERQTTPSQMRDKITDNE